MARLITNHPLLKNARGRIGNLLIKQTKKGPIVCMLPDYSKYKPNENQKRQNAKFARAAAYASAINNDPEQHAQWQTKLKKGESVYHAAFKHYLRNPENDSAKGQ